MIYLLCKDKYQGQGHAFGSTSNPIDYSVALLSSDGSLPESYADVQANAVPYDFAPGSLLFDTANTLKYVFNGQEWVIWGEADE